MLFLQQQLHFLNHFQETRGGRSYKKVIEVYSLAQYLFVSLQLGYVPINLSEFAGAGVVQRKYLLESYNEYKHKPDNSILRVKIALRQTSGDVLFKAYVYLYSL